MINTYPEAVQYLYDNLPMFQRIGAAAFKKDLTNTIRLCEALGNPQLKFKSVHVAGTNGKGSTSHMLASVLQTAGYKTGLYTSPHLKEFTERVKVDGREIGQRDVVDFVNRLLPVIEEVKPSFFEITVAMAFDYFARQQVNVAIIEVGLGGRLDSTNVITPVVSVITNIGWDHQDLLGNTLPDIAWEKAGIIKPGIPVVVSERQKDVEHVFQAKSVQGKSTLYFASDSYTADVTSGHTFTIKKDHQLFIDKLKLPLQGSYQKKNLPGVCKALELLSQHGFAISKQSIVDGLENVVNQTGLKGRWQKLQEHPLVICDTGHNVDGFREIVSQIQQQEYDKLYMVMGTVKDKDVTDVLKLLPKDAYYYFCQAKIPRALDAGLLREKATALGLSGEVIPDVNEALKAALRQAKRNDMIFIGGSTFVVAEIESL